jgi:hypothetical protein
MITINGELNQATDGSLLNKLALWGRGEGEFFIFEWVVSVVSTGKDSSTDIAKGTFTPDSFGAKYFFCCFSLAIITLTICLALAISPYLQLVRRIPLHF